MKKYYVSLTKDLLGYYLVFLADSEESVRNYLFNEYNYKGTWKLPWMTTYEEEPIDGEYGPVHLIDRTHQPLIEIRANA